ncbi:MAG: FAD:protein FMN transferase [Verrucomicrobiota bacterium]|jgi:thiamine biosynthesis lipoprotein|nr:FAD:protein FMN transferase [Verrucomicrobiota bacterium]
MEESGTMNSNPAAKFLFALFFLATTGQAERHEFSRPLMGMTFRIVVHADDAGLAKRAVQAAFDRVAALNRIMSDYDPESELNRLSNLAGSGKSARISKELCAVLDRAQKLANDTGGAFDVTAGASVQHWRRARRLKRLPPEQVLDTALKTVGFRRLNLDAKNCTAELAKPGMRLDLGGIAKGHALDEALAALKRQGVRKALVSAGGDIVAGSAPPGKKGWRVALIGLGEKAEPELLWLANAAVATSGDLFQFLEIDGTRYSHIVDPRTGRALTEQRLVHVIAPDGITADSVATAISVLGPSDGFGLVKGDKRLGARVAFRGALGQVQLAESPVFRAWPRAGE